MPKSSDPIELTYKGLSNWVASNDKAPAMDAVWTFKQSLRHFKIEERFMKYRVLYDDVTKACSRDCVSASCSGPMLVTRITSLFQIERDLTGTCFETYNQIREAQTIIGIILKIPTDRKQDFPKNWNNREYICWLFDRVALVYHLLGPPATTPGPSDRQGQNTALQRQPESPAWAHLRGFLAQAKQIADPSPGARAEAGPLILNSSGTGPTPPQGAAAASPAAASPAVASPAASRRSTSAPASLTRRSMSVERQRKRS